jgi:hypothetical protein
VSHREANADAVPTESNTGGVVNHINNEPPMLRTERTEANTEIPSESVIEKRQLNVSRPLPSAQNKTEGQQENKKELKRGE